MAGLAASEGATTRRRAGAGGGGGALGRQLLLLAGDDTDLTCTRVEMPGRDEGGGECCVRRSEEIGG